MKALKKEDIIAQFNALQAKYDILENKNLAMEKEIKTHRSYLSFRRNCKIFRGKKKCRNTDKRYSKR